MLGRQVFILPEHLRSNNSTTVAGAKSRQPMLKRSHRATKHYCNERQQVPRPH